MTRIILAILITVASSCTLFNGFRKQTFTEGDGNSFKILVPKGWSNVAVNREADGTFEKVYRYSNGTSFYVSNTDKPFTPNKIIDTARHIPLQSPTGGLIYKGVMPGLLYWREIQQNNFRFGYRNVPVELESRFDSAVNYSALMKEN